MKEFPFQSFPILLGRGFLKNEFLIDVTKEYTTSF